MASSEIDSDVLDRVQSIRDINLSDPGSSSTTIHSQGAGQSQPSLGLASSEKKALPMVVPQLRWEHGQGVFGSPFARVYPTELAKFGIGKADFLTFLDGFNDTFTSTRTGQSVNFAFRVLNLAYGHKIVELDNPHAKPGPASSASSTTTTTATTDANNESKSYGRVLLYLQAMNKDVFQPKGLHVSVLRTDDMTHKVGYPSQKLALLPRENVAGQAPETNAVIQRMKPLQGYVSDIDTEVPPAGSSSNLFKSLVEHRNHRQEQARDKRQALRDRHSAILSKRSNKKESEIQKKLGKLEAELLEHKETAEKRIAANPGDQTATAEFERTKARIVKEVERLTKQKPSENLQDQQMRAATRKAQVEASHVRWLVISNVGTGPAQAAAVREGNLETEHDILSSDDELHHE